MNKTALSLILIFAIGAWGQQPIVKSHVASLSATAPVSGPFSEHELQEFTSLDPIDTHTHIFRNDTSFYAMLKKLHLHMLDILVDDDYDVPPLNNFAMESRYAWQVVHGSDGQVSLCTTFDPFKWRQPDFSQAAIRQINHDFDQGAIAVKIWKNIGMEIKDAKGNYIMPDDPVFEPIYKDIAKHNKTLIANVADPDIAWEPPPPTPPDYDYFKEHPEWYMYGKSHPASKEDILRARDHLLEQNPNLRVVGAHLGSMEDDFNQLAQHLDRYPNFAVDIAARMDYLMSQPRVKMIAFITKYQDRLIYGTDNGLMPGDNPHRTLTAMENGYARDWRFLATNDTLDYQGHTSHGLTQGLALPLPILRKLYHDNAVKWFPGILVGVH